MSLVCRRSVFLFLTICIALIAIFYSRGIYQFQHIRFPLHRSPMSARPPVIVVGGGLAGLSASFAALRAGSAVILLEREAKPGGNSIKASSGISAAPTRYQAGPGPDTQFFSDSIRSVGWRLNDEGKLHREKLVSRLTNQSTAALDFLVDEIGVDLSVVSLLGGHSVPRTHRGSGKIPPGFAIVSAVLERLKKDENFELRTGHEVTRVLSAAQKHTGDVSTSVTGVEVVHEGKSTIMNGPVIFTTGGFAGDANGLLAKYRPDLAGYPSTNSPIPGMHQLLTAAGAQLVDMDSVQIHPTGFVNPANPNEWSKILAAEMLRGEGGILLYKGKRFVNEVDTREYVSKAMMGLPAEEKSPSSDSDSMQQWNIQLLLDAGAAARAMNHIGFYAAKGLLVKKAVRDLDDGTRATLREYSAIVAGSKKDEFGRQNFGNWALMDAEEDGAAEVYIGQVTPTVHFTMGGVVIGEKGEVLASPIGTQQPAAIRGLWAAGEVTGGIHGNNRLGGSSLLECVVFGLMAGEQAGEFAKIH